MRAPLTLTQGDEPLLRFRARKRLTNRIYEAIDLSTVGAIQWVSKSSANASDASGIMLAGVIVQPAIAGNFTVQIPASVTAVAGNFVYKVIIVVSGHPTTLQYGPLTVEST